MAMMDNRAFLISHIRNSFITSDNTSMCEHIIEKDKHFERDTWALDRCLSYSENISSSSDEDLTNITEDVELAHSPDILPDMFFTSHRPRLGTEIRMEKLKEEKRHRNKVKTISWKNVEQPEGPSDFFIRRPISAPKGKLVSALAGQLQHSRHVTNSFIDYAKFDGKTSSGVPIKRIYIYMTMMDGNEAKWPLKVTTLCTARVYDLIGLACWLYTTEGKKPDLPDNLNRFSLHIAEDDGEVDGDFPALDPKEPISKFDFAKLALVQNDTLLTIEKPSYVVTINMPNRGSSSTTVEDDQLPLRNFLDAVLKRRGLKQIPGLNYQLEKQEHPGKSIDLDQPLSAFDSLEFCLVRENSVRGDIEETEPNLQPCDIATSLISLQYKCYNLDLCHRLRANTEVQLGVCGLKIEINPVITKGGSFFKQKPLVYDTNTIAACTMTSSKSSRAGFRLVYQHGSDFRHHHFESSRTVAEEITQRIKYIIEMRASHVVAEYQLYREKKQEKRPTISLMPT